MPITDEDLYAHAMSEVESGTTDAGLWAKAFALAEGDENKTKALYVKLRVQAELTKLQDRGLPGASEVSPLSGRATTGEFCPQCNSEDWKLCSVVQSAGISYLDAHTSTLAVGIGLGGGIRVGIGGSSGDASGVLQTELSRRAAPPTDPRTTGEWSGYDDLKTAEARLAEYEAHLLSRRSNVDRNRGTWSVSSDIWRDRLVKKVEGARKFSEAIERYEEVLKDWPITRICMRCGTLFVPGKLTDSR